MSRPSLFELWQQAHGDPDTYHRLMVEHGHLVPRPACTCNLLGDSGTHQRECPRYADNDRRLPCGWLPGTRR